MPSHTPHTSPGPEDDPNNFTPEVQDTDIALDRNQVTPRFCRRCGAPFPPGADACACEFKVTTLKPGRDLQASSIRGALALYFTLLITLLVVYLGDGVEYQMATGVIDAVVVLVWCAVCWKVIQPGLNIPQMRWWILPVPLALLTFTVASISVYFIEYGLGIEQIGYTGPFFQAGYGWPMLILFVCVQPAVIEELAFRGIILKTLTRVLSAREAIIVSALMFMTLHLSVPSFPHLFFIGLVLGWVRVRSGSIFPAIILHFSHNFFCLIAEAYGF